ncbi:MAG: ATP-binding protein [Treponema sp.]|nr:ATP-binding protein [Treponema sp.]
MPRRKNTILSQIINASEKIEGSKLEKSVIESIRPQLTSIANYLTCDEMSTIFFIVIFVILNQNQTVVNMHDIANFLDYSFLHILEYRSKITLLENKGLIFMKKRTNVSSHPENNGYGIGGAVLNNIIDGDPIVFYEQEEMTTENILNEIQAIEECFWDDGMDFCEYKRQVCNLENQNAQNVMIKSIKKLFPDDFDTRSFLYFYCFSTVNNSEPFENEARRGFQQSSAFRFISGSKRYNRAKSLSDDTDVLLVQNLLERTFEETGNYYNGKPCIKISYKLTPGAIKKIFKNEAQNYLKEEDILSETEKTINALNEFGYAYEDRNVTRATKEVNLRRLEKKRRTLPFFKQICNIIQYESYRFFLYDCTKDFTKGEITNTCSTLNDLYGHSQTYFKELRALLDEKHYLVENGFLEVNKNEVVERTTLTVTDKVIDLLYGKNSELYKKGVSGKDIIQTEKIKEKQLFYSPEVQKQIDMLEESLNQQNLVAMQERLAKKGLCKGIAVILYGAPGTGKTETVYQLAKKTNRKILHVDIADSKSCWFGESEKLIKKIFTNYKSLCKTCKSHNENTPILLFNEADALIQKRRDLDSNSCATTENAIQNILLEEMEKLEGIMIATTNLCNNMDKAFERRFLFKIKYERPSLQARKKIWQSKINCIDDEHLEKLALEFDFSGGEIDNIVRKCEMNEIIKGHEPSYEEVVELCQNERLESENCHRVGFCA